MKLIFFLFFLLIKWQQVSCQCFPSSGVPAPTTLNDTAGRIDRYGVGGFTSLHTCQWILTPPSFSDFLLYIDVTRLGTTVKNGCTSVGLILPDGSAQCSDLAQFRRTCFLYSHSSTPSSCQDDVTTRSCGNASVLAANQWPPSIRFVVGFVVLDAGFALNYEFINCTDSETTTASTTIATTQAAVTSAFATAAATTEPTTSLEPTTTTSLEPTTITTIASLEPTTTTTSQEQSTSASTLLEPSTAIPMPTITQVTIGSTTTTGSNDITTSGTNDNNTKIITTIPAENSNPTTAGLTISTTTDDPGVMPQFSLPIYFYPAIGGAVLLLLFLIIGIVIIRKRRSKAGRFFASSGARSSTDAIVANDYVGSNTIRDSAVGSSEASVDAKSAYVTMDETFIADVPTYATIETGPDALTRMTSSNTITGPGRKSRSSSRPRQEIPSTIPRTHTVDEITDNQRKTSIMIGQASNATPDATDGQRPYDLADTADVVTGSGLGATSPDESEYVIMANSNDVNAQSQHVYSNDPKEDDEDDDFTSDESDEEPPPDLKNLYAEVMKP